MKTNCDEEEGGFTNLYTESFEVFFKTGNLAAHSVQLHTQRLPGVQLQTLPNTMY
jgi:hypothetical protein